MAEFQGAVPASLPPGTRIATDTVAGQEYQWVKIDVGGTGASVPLTSLNSGAWLSQAGRSILITYTDATKTTIDHVDYKEGASTIYTLTLTGPAATSDLWTRS